MPSTTKRLGLILILIVLMPVIFFSAYEIGSMRENEKLVTNIYNEQLRSILSSVNQYSDDAVRAWAVKLQLYLSFEEKIKHQQVKDFMRQTPSVNMFFCTDSIFSGHTQIFHPQENFDKMEKTEFISNFLQSMKEDIEKIKGYMINTGYRKILPVPLGDKKEPVIFLFVVRTASNDMKVCGIEVDPTQFVSEFLGNRIQVVSSDVFEIVIMNEINDNIVYRTGENELPTTEKIKKEFQSESMWLLPGYNMLIRLKEQTIDDLVRQRTKINLVLIILIDIILIFGVWLVFKNVSKEVKLAGIKSEFISNVSHEIRTPLALISMYIETLEMGRIKSQEKIREYYRVIYQETQRLSGIVNKILNFSQIERGKRKYKDEEIDVNHVAEDIFHTYQPHMERKGFSYNIELSSDLPKIMADTEALADAIVNLIDNGIKYSKDKKHIECRTGLSNNYVFIEIEDQGLGIPPSKQKQIFDKFYRVTSGNLAHHAKGTGLGLAIVKNFMDHFDGKITLRSEVGKGSCFRLNFPVKKS